MTQLQDKQKERLIQVEKTRKNAQTKAAVFSEVFGNPQGIEVLEEIKNQFDPSVLAIYDNANATIIRAAQRDVVRWIEEVITRGQTNAVEG